MSRECSVDGCGGKSVGRGLCRRHYYRWRRYGDPLTNGRLSSEILRERMTIHGHTVGGRSPTYRSWHAMLRRCTTPSATKYRFYGGAGVTVTKRWRSFANFLADMGERPPGMTLDRKNNDRGYNKQNCRWVDRSEQRRNQRRQRRVRRSDGRVFRDCKAAAEATGGSSSNITKACRGKRKTCAGYGWMYL